MFWVFVMLKVKHCKLLGFVLFVRLQQQATGAGISLGLERLLTNYVAYHVIDTLSVFGPVSQQYEIRRFNVVL